MGNLHRSRVPVASRLLQGGGDFFCSHENLHKFWSPKDEASPAIVSFVYTMLYFRRVSQFLLALFGIFLALTWFPASKRKLVNKAFPRGMTALFIYHKVSAFLLKFYAESNSKLTESLSFDVNCFIRASRVFVRQENRTGKKRSFFDYAETSGIIRARPTLDQSFLLASQLFR